MAKKKEEEQKDTTTQEKEVSNQDKINEKEETEKKTYERG